MRDRRWYPGYTHRERYRQCLANIKRLEEWHRIFNEFSSKGDWLQAAYMADHGVAYTSYVLMNYYMPAIRKQLNVKNIITGITGQ